MADFPPYPKRPRFYSNKVIRRMSKVCLANEIGADACYLLTVVVATEDAKSYSSPVTFFNEQLMPLVGCKSPDSLARVRQRAIDCGWLKYLPGGKGRPGSYYVDVPPGYRDIDDTPVDEVAGEFSTAKMRKEPRKNRDECAERTAEEPRKNRDECAEHSSFPIPVLLLSSATPPNPPPAGGGFCEPPPAVADAAGPTASPTSEPAAAKTPVKARKPRKAPLVGPPKPRPPNPLFDAVAEVCGLDPATAGGLIGKVAAALSKAEPAYAPEDVRRFAREFWKHCPYAARDARTRPTPAEIQKNIGLLRAAPPPPQQTPASQQTPDEKRNGYAFKILAQLGPRTTEDDDDEPTIRIDSGRADLDD